MDYFEKITQPMEKPELVKLATAGWASAVMVDICWGRAAGEILGEGKAHEVCERAWIKLGEYSCALTMNALGITKITSFDELKNLINACYQGTNYKMKINESNENVLSWEILDCYFPSFGYAFFDVKEGDSTCNEWKHGTYAWLMGIIKKAGLAGAYEPSISSGICCGDATCRVQVKKVA
jgi:hypothetical protein